MKVLHLSTYDFDGGASRAAYRLHSALHNAGVTSQMLVYDKFSYDANVIGPDNRFDRGLNLIRPQIDQLPLYMFPRRERSTWSTSLLPNSIEKKITRINPDLVHIHWVGFGFLPINALPHIRKPIVWTFHDMWAFTGGCHYSGACNRYVDKCGSCPQLNSRFDHDLSRLILSEKKARWKNKNLVVVTPSRWLADCARTSALFSNHRIEIIPNPLDLITYKPVEKSIARNLLNLPIDDKIILFVAINARHEPRKGYDTLKEGLRRFSEIYPVRDITLLVVGTGEPEKPEELPYKTRYLGRLRDDYSMVLAYSAADIFIAPSLQENLPNTIMEAMACGTPCVAFDVGGIPDMIEHRGNGYLAKPFESTELADGVAWILSDADCHHVLAEKARAKTESSYESELIMRKYLSLYHELLNGTDHLS